MDSNIVLIKMRMIAGLELEALIDESRARLEPLERSVVVMSDRSWAPMMQKENVSAAFIGSVDHSVGDPELLSQFASEGQRILVDDETLEPDGFDVLRSLPLPGVELAMEYLARSHRDIAYIGVRPDVVKPYPAAETGYVAFMRALGWPVKANRIVSIPEPDPQLAFDAAIAMFRQRPLPEAILVGGDIFALAIISAAHSLGLSVPEDVAIMGMGNSPQGRLSRPALSSVGPIDLPGVVADRLRDLATENGAAPGELITLPWKLHLRDTA